MKQFEQDLWVLLKPAPSVPGEWIAHCLSLDVISQGKSAQHALEMLAEAIAMVVFDDLERGANPMERGVDAPAEDWEEWQRILKGGHKVSLGDATKNAKGTFVVQATFRARLKQHEQEIDFAKQTPAWMIDQVSAGQHAAHSH